ncbi:MAG: hypothetical protein U0787_19035 [Polyangia bacterium]
MKRQQPRRRNARKLIIWACLSIGIFLLPDAAVAQTARRQPNDARDAASAVDDEDLHITVGKNAKNGDEDFEAYDAPTPFREADALFEADKFADAAQKYEKLVVNEFSDSPFAPPALFNAALSLEAPGRYGEASDRYKQVVALFPSSKNAKRRPRSARPRVWPKWASGCSRQKRWLSSKSVMI